MFRPHQTTAPRQGVILLVVLSMLMLFAIVGISFVIYANAEANTNRAFRDAPSVNTTDMDAEQIGAFALGQIIYDVPDDLRGAYSGLRGHSFARNMYGYNDAGLATNDTPYSGPGRFNVPSMFPNSTVALANNDAYLINYTYFASADASAVAVTTGTDLPMRDPERLGTRPPYSTLLKANPNLTYDQYVNLPIGHGTYTAQNPSYTYADHNSLFLAAVKADGTVLSPSYHREAIFGRFDDPANPNWLNQEGKYLTLRPRPIDMGPGFPYPVDRGGDVKNLIWAPGGCDSPWIDMNAPIMTAADGRRYKMLVAPLIMDLDNRLNVNAHGNIMGANNPNIPGSAHNGNQMWGPWEVNVSKVLNANPSEWTQLFTGKPNPVTGQFPPVIPGKYGSQYGTLQQQQVILANPFGGAIPHYPSQVDFNGGLDGAGTAVPFQIPGSSSSDGSVVTVPFQLYPSFPGAVFGNANTGEMTNNASMYNPFRPTPGFGNNRVLAASDMHALLRRKDSGSEAITSAIERLLPINLSTADPLAVRRRMMLTVSSWDLDRPAMIPYHWDPQNMLGTNGPQQYQLVYNQNAATGLFTNYPYGASSPTGQPIAFPGVNMTNRPATPAGSEFDPATWRSTLGKLGRIDLNRQLTAYTAVDAKGNSLFHLAELDRQNLAKDIFNRLCLVTGATSPFVVGTMTPKPVAPSPYDPTFEASRYLAQLAANMVDYIDGDDYNTVFVWNPLDPTVTDPWNDPNNNNFQAANIRSQIVFGTEPPKLALNEVYVQFDNIATDTGIVGTPGKPVPFKPVNQRQAKDGFNVNVWVELVNPTISEAPNYDNTAYLIDPNNNNNQVYQVMLIDAPPAGTPFLTPDNVLGDPPAGVKIRNIGANGAMDYGTKPAPNAPTPGSWYVSPLNGQYAGNGGGNQGFYVLGPAPQNGALWLDQTGDKDPNITQNPQNPNLPMSYPSTSMSYPVPLAGPGGAVATAADHKPMVLLRRLVYPNQPPNPAMPGGAYVPGTPYNPYITVDYLDPVASTDSRIYSSGAGNIGVANKNYVSMGSRTTFGRKQPYDSNTPLVAQAPLKPNLQATSPQNTFFRHNYIEDVTGQNPPTNQSTSVSLTIPFNWLTHLDRQLISPVELLHVSAHKPHELTHVFVQNGSPYNQGAPWLKQDSRLYRFLEMIETQSRLPGTYAGSRVPGKVNINTLQDMEVFLGLCDAQPGNTFYNTDATLVNSDGTKATTDYYARKAFEAMMAYRSPNGVPSLNDRPFKSLGATYAQGGDALDPNSVPPFGLPVPLQPTPRGLNDTIFANNGQQQIFVPQVPNAAQLHPYQQAEMLNKLYNNITTHSNTFAVFLTIGFFEVTDETTRPVKLGPEINALQGTNIRHRVFAIVDRTNLEAFGSPVLLQSPIDTPTGAYPYEVQLDALIPNSKSSTYVMPLNGINQNTTKTWQIQSGSVVVIDPNTPNEETVTVYNKAGANLFAMFRRPHLAGASIISRGNPGPWLRYNPRADTNVVPFYAIID